MSLVSEVSSKCISCNQAICKYHENLVYSLDRTQLLKLVSALSGNGGLAIRTTHAFFAALEAAHFPSKKPMKLQSRVLMPHILTPSTPCKCPPIRWDKAAPSLITMPVCTKHVVPSALFGGNSCLSRSPTTHCSGCRASCSARGAGVRWLPILSAIATSATAASPARQRSAHRRAASGQTDTASAHVP